MFTKPNTQYSLDVTFCCWNIFQFISFHFCIPCNPLTDGADSWVFRYRAWAMFVLVIVESWKATEWGQVEAECLDWLLWRYYTAQFYQHQQQDPSLRKTKEILGNKDSLLLKYSLGQSLSVQWQKLKSEATFTFSMLFIGEHRCVSVLDWLYNIYNIISVYTIFNII